MNKRKLIIGLRRGDHDSYEALFKLYYVKFVNFADAIIKDRNAAKDIVQDAFIKIWANRLKLDETQSLENYIYVIVKRLVLNYIRDHRPSESLESEAVQMVQSMPWGGQELVVIANETSSKIRAAVSKMPTQRRKVFVMSRYQGMSNSQIAQTLQISVKTVERHMTLALSELRENIS